MQRKTIKSVLLNALPVMWISATALAGDGVAINVTNDGTEDIIVTVYDLGIGPNGVVIAHSRINGFATVPVSAVANSSGVAKLAWTAVTADPAARKCGHQDAVELADASSLAVHADTACGTST